MVGMRVVRDCCTNKKGQRRVVGKEDD